MSAAFFRSYSGFAQGAGAQAAPKSPTSPSGRGSLAMDASPKTKPVSSPKTTDLAPIADAVAKLQIKGKSLPIARQDITGKPGIVFWQNAPVLLFQEYQMDWAKSFVTHLCDAEKNPEFAELRADSIPDSSGVYDGWVRLSSDPSDWITFFDKHLKFTSDQVTQLVLNILTRLPRKSKETATSELLPSVSEQLHTAYQEYLLAQMAQMKKASAVKSIEGERKSKA